MAATAIATTGQAVPPERIAILENVLLEAGHPDAAFLHGLLANEIAAGGKPDAMGLIRRALPAALDREEELRFLWRLTVRARETGYLSGHQAAPARGQIQWSR